MSLQNYRDLSRKRKLVQLWLVCLLSVAFVPNVRLVAAQSLCEVRCESATPFLRPLKSLWQRTSNRVQQLGKEDTHKMDSRHADGKDMTFTQFMTSLIVASDRHSQLGPLRHQLVGVVQQYQTCMRACEHQHSKRAYNLQPGWQSGLDADEAGSNSVLDMINQGANLHRQKQHNNGRRTRNGELPNQVAGEWSNYLINPEQPGDSMLNSDEKADVLSLDSSESPVGNSETENETSDIIDQVKFALEQLELLRSNALQDSNQSDNDEIENVGAVVEEMRTNPWFTIPGPVHNLRLDNTLMHDGRMYSEKRGWGSVPWLFKAKRQHPKYAQMWAQLLPAKKRISPAPFGQYLKPGFALRIREEMQKRGWSTLPMSYRRTDLLRKLLQSAPGNS